MSVSTQATFESGHTDQIHDCQYDYYGRVRARSSPSVPPRVLPSAPSAAARFAAFVRRAVGRCARTEQTPPALPGARFPRGAAGGFDPFHISFILRARDLVSGRKVCGVVSRVRCALFLTDGGPPSLNPSSSSHFLRSPPQRVATCSSDRTIKVFDVSGDQQTLVGNLTGHDGPVWQCAWAHPKFGTLLASCSFDHKVIVWKESEQGVFSAIYTSPATLHEASVNAIAWAPHEFGLALVRLAYACHHLAHFDSSHLSPFFRAAA